MASHTMIENLSTLIGGRFGEHLHLPLAAGCNVRCTYCIPGNACVDHYPTGVSENTLLSPDEAMNRVENFIEKMKRKPKVLIAGPGEPLASTKTYEFLEMAKKEYPKLDITLATNGLLLPDRFRDLLNLNVSTLRITINASTPETAELLHPWVLYRRSVHHGTRGALLLLNNQWSGLIASVETGFVVRVHFVAVPGVNTHEATTVAKTAGRLGADCMKVVALPKSKAPCSVEAVALTDVGMVRDECDRYLPQV